MTQLPELSESMPTRPPSPVPRQPFDAVVELHGSTVLRVCRAILDPADADDAWSETFLAAMTAYPQLADDANVEAWLVTIAHRKAVDVTRAASRRAVPTDDVPDTPVAPDEGPDGELVRALAGLTDKQRQAVAYHYLAGLTYAEVGRIVGCSEAAARRAAADGIAVLRRSYPGVNTHSVKGETQ